MQDLTALRSVAEEIVASRTLRRSEVLKRLLIYLVDQHEAGRIYSVTEYELGVKALGRPPDFAPDSDSSVRSRMHALRQKLEEYYRDEAPGASVRLEFPRRSYAPDLVIVGLEPAEPERPSESERSPRRRSAGLLIALAAALAIGAVALWEPWSRPDAALVSLWRPFLDAEPAVAILVGQPVHLWLRDAGSQPEPEQYPHFPDPVSPSESLRRYYSQRLPSAQRLVLHPSPNATLWGDAAGAGAAARFFAFRRKYSELLPESTLQSEVAVRGRPVVALGRPEFSPAVARYLLTANGYTSGMLNSKRRYAIYRPQDPRDHYLNTDPPDEVTHGLITLLDDGPVRVVVFSGITSDGSAAGVDYLTNTAAVAELKRRLESEGFRDWPRVFQVIVRTRSSRGYAMTTSYEKHLVLKR